MAHTAADRVQVGAVAVHAATRRLDKVCDLDERVRLERHLMAVRQIVVGVWRRDDHARRHYRVSEVPIVVLQTAQIDVSDAAHRDTTLLMAASTQS